jgi:5-formyltetrahydrofolate cyclo-ligase
MDGISEDKARLREDLLAARRARSDEDCEAARSAIRRHVLTRAAGVERIAAYLPLRTEPGSVELLAELHALGAAVIIPVTLPDRDLDWAPWTPEDVGLPLGVDAVREAGLVLAPALAVARDGTRLGRGGGSYDRALSRCADATVVTAIVFDDEIVERLPRDPWDRPVHAAVSPGGWIALTGNTDWDKAG